MYIYIYILEFRARFARAQFSRISFIGALSIGTGLMGRMSNLYPLVGSVPSIERKPVERLTTYKLNAFGCHGEKTYKTERKT